MKLKDAILGEVLADLEAKGIELSAVVRERAAELATTAAEVAARSMTTGVSPLELQVLKARAANLEAAISIGVSALVAQAANRAILAVVKTAFAALV